MEIPSEKERLIQKSAIVLGIGNTIRKDDGVGIAVVEALERNLGGQSNLAFETMQSGGVDILNSVFYGSEIPNLDCAECADY